jgi:hypothetical protein
MTSLQQTPGKAPAENAAGIQSTPACVSAGNNWLSNKVKKGGRKFALLFFVVISIPAGLFSCSLIPALRGIELRLCVRLLSGFMISLALVMFG